MRYCLSGHFLSPLTVTRWTGIMLIVRQLQVASRHHLMRFRRKDILNPLNQHQERESSFKNISSNLIAIAPRDSYIWGRESTRGAMKYWRVKKEERERERHKINAFSLMHTLNTEWCIHWDEGAHIKVKMTCVQLMNYCNISLHETFVCTVKGDRN